MTALDALERRFDQLGEVAVAVSGGVDSMTLAVIAHLRLGDRAAMVHAVSAAVPPEATVRVQRYAAERGWRLRLVDAGELRDDAYLRNPRDRCYICKTHLYASIARHTLGQIVAGTNTDDLGEYRPGLVAAEEHGVVHPYVEAGVSKAAVRALARELGLRDLADLPAAPCLASRIETGITIEPHRLRLVHRIEQALAGRLDPAAVRCRIRAGGTVVELDQDRLDRLTAAERAWIHTLLHDAGGPKPVRLAPYRTGSAFLEVPDG